MANNTTAQLPSDVGKMNGMLLFAIIWCYQLPKVWDVISDISYFIYKKKEKVSFLVLWV